MDSPRLLSGNRIIKVPISLLLTKDLTPAAKLLWIRLRFDEMHPRQRSQHPRQLAKRACLARSTIYEALQQAEATGWITKHLDPATGLRRWKTTYAVRTSPQDVVQIPADLIRSAHALRPQAILCYGLLQALPTFNTHARTGSFKWAELREMTGLHLRTIKRAVRGLVKTRWISLSQRNRKAPIWFRVQYADLAYQEEVKRSLERSQYIGEALMRCFLSIIADTQECEDGARPEFLVNPVSGERLELDRYYPLHRVAFEFNGRQHYVATGRFTKEVVAAQRKRDRIKQQICKEKNVKLVVVHAEDLSLSAMLKKVGTLLPKTVLRGFRRTIQFLNHCGLRYRLATERA